MKVSVTFRRDTKADDFTQWVTAFDRWGDGVIKEFIVGDIVPLDAEFLYVDTNRNPITSVFRVPVQKPRSLLTLDDIVETHLRKYFAANDFSLSGLLAHWDETMLRVLKKLFTSPYEEKWYHSHRKLIPAVVLKKEQNTTICVHIQQKREEE